MSRQLERLVVSFSAGVLFGIAAVGGFSWLRDSIDVAACVAGATIFAAYAIELAVANGLELARRPGVRGRARQARDGP